MSVRRFMIQSHAVCDGSASFDGGMYNHMVRVLRLGAGDEVQLADERGVVYSGIIDEATKERVGVRITSVVTAAGINGDIPRITICQALPKGDKIDLILQKGTELGAHDFRLFGGRRSVARIRDDQQAAKRERWHKIVAEAARQCGRPDIPEVTWHPDAGDAADAGHELRLILWEREKVHTLKQALSAESKPTSVIVAIGPEGGFDPGEVELFVRQGFQPVSLGPRILRTETASIAILAVMQYTWDG